MQKIGLYTFLFINFFIYLRSYGIEVAITVDDIPSYGNIPLNTNRLQLTKEMLSIFKKHGISGVYGMINGEKINNNFENIEVLKEWIKGGQLLGNNTFSHMDIVKNSSKEYIEDIKKNESILKSYMKNKDYKYFRYPYLAEGETKEKRDSVRTYLFNNNYKISHVTMGFFEHEWNEPYVRCVKKNDLKQIQYLKESYLKKATESIYAAQSLSKLIFNRDIKYIFLMHIGAFNVQVLDQLLTNFEKNGVKFISLEKALSDPVYQINTEIKRDRSYTFLNQLRLHKKLENPPIVRRFYDGFPEDLLPDICSYTIST